LYLRIISGIYTCPRVRFRVRILQHIVVNCNTMQHAATRVSSHIMSDTSTCPRVHIRKLNLNMATHHNNLQHTATTCNTQQLTRPRASLSCAYYRACARVTYKTRLHGNTLQRIATQRLCCTWSTSILYLNIFSIALHSQMVCMSTTQRISCAYTPRVYSNVPRGCNRLQHAATHCKTPGVNSNVPRGHSISKCIRNLSSPECVCVCVCAYVCVCARTTCARVRLCVHVYICLCEHA